MASQREQPDVLTAHQKNRLESAVQRLFIKYGRCYLSDLEAETGLDRDQIRSFMDGQVIDPDSRVIPTLDERGREEQHCWTIQPVR